MRILVILCSHEFDLKWRENVRNIKRTLESRFTSVHFCGISSQHDFDNYENMLEFKFKMI
jgi:hypothetical protein